MGPQFRALHHRHLETLSFLALPARETWRASPRPLHQAGAARPAYPLPPLGRPDPEEWAAPLRVPPGLRRLLWPSSALSAQAAVLPGLPRPVDRQDGWPDPVDLGQPDDELRAGPARCDSDRRTVSASEPTNIGCRAARRPHGRQGGGRLEEATSLVQLSRPGPLLPQRSGVAGVPDIPLGFLRAYSPMCSAASRLATPIEAVIARARPIWTSTRADLQRRGPHSSRPSGAGPARCSRRLENSNFYVEHWAQLGGLAEES